MDIPKPFPELGSSTDTAQVPWKDAIVWAEWVNGVRVYEWLKKENIRQASWTTGSLSIEVNDTSFLCNTVKFLLIRGPFITIGQNVSLG